jgi:hypothetical protein
MKAVDAPSPSSEEGCVARRVLTVGDGDLSYSLALARAYGSRVRLTATTLLTEAELLATYERAAHVLEELRALPHVRVVHGVNACTLHRDVELAPCAGSAPSGHIAPSGPHRTLVHTANAPPPHLHCTSSATHGCE